MAANLIYFLSAFSANKTGSPTTNPDTTAMVSMFCEDSEDSKSTAMIKQSNGYDLESCRSLEQRSTYCCCAGPTNVCHGQVYSVAVTRTVWHP